MEWLLVPAGVFLVLVGLLVVFFTVLHYDGFGFLSSRAATLRQRLKGLAGELCGHEHEAAVHHEGGAGRVG